MRARIGQDLASGLLFIFVGGIALLVGANYPMGTPRAPGTGVLPRILAFCLVATGAVIVVKSLIGRDTPMSRWAWRPMLLVLLSVIVFARCIDSLGMLVTMSLSMTLCALGTPETRWREYLLFAAFMLALSWGLFVKALGMPIPTWPVRVPPDIARIGELLATVVR